MIELKSITKDYIMANSKVEALRGIDLTFRDNEFVSILGPSGCGKTTLLNIIGGLDKKSSGDLVIDGVSTRDYKDRDWDTYRNHKVGFVFQSYNLIPHQTILENVELALNIAGIKKEERIRRAREVLDRVGLEGQYNKKPSQLSGGQCQRVAIARALVNDPEILLADEPTGALDTTTSVQIMELIKDIAKNTLVVMVTHNPELAERYSTRIIRLLDGKIVDDSNPCEKKEDKTIKEDKSTRKSKLSLFSAIKLSWRNLLSKLKRTLTVCIAGSIGIIGVASVLAVSVGINNYIYNMQNDMLSGNPVTIQESTYDLSSILGMYSTFSKGQAVVKSIEKGYINVDEAVKSLVEMSETTSNMRVQNSITDNYVKFVTSAPSNILSAYKLDYGIDLPYHLYTPSPFTNQDGEMVSVATIRQIYTSILEKTELKDYAYLATNLDNIFLQLPSSEDFVLEQYDVLTEGGEASYPKSETELTLVVDADSELTDLLLAQLGYYTEEEFINVIYKATGDDRFDASLDREKFSYTELLGKTLTYYPNNDIFSINYIENTQTINQAKPFIYNAYADDSFSSGLNLTITSILHPKAGLNYGALKSGLYYTSSLIDRVLENGEGSEIVDYMDTMDIEAFTSGKVTTQYGESDMGITYTYSFTFDGVDYDETGYVGSINTMTAFISFGSGMNIPTYYSLTKRDLGGIRMPNKISLYNRTFDEKNELLKYLDKWNSDDVLIIDGESVARADRETIKYTDNLSLIINMVSSMINIVTSALVAFSALSLVVSTVMIAIITYVSVIERIKEIGVIRSLGGRKRDVARLFIVESAIIGLFSGIIGLGITGLITLLINTLAGMTMSSLTIGIILSMLLVSTLLTITSGLIPASLASKKDPVIALRTD